MNPDAQKLWAAPQWAFAILLAVLGMLGAFYLFT
jgi:DHA1 family bicyclomycin/chloramphenicol resistance-like MFS transporter